MPFHFSLQPLLHFRQGLQRQQELRLLEANHKVARVQQLVDKVTAQMQNVNAQQAESLQAGTTSAELRFEMQRQESLALHRRNLEGALAKIKTLRDEQQRIFLEARRQSQTLESLRDLQLRTYKREAARREQKSLDDLFLLRRAYLHRG